MYLMCTDQNNQETSLKFLFFLHYPESLQCLLQQHQICLLDKKKSCNREFQSCTASFRRSSLVYVIATKNYVKSVKME